MTRRLSPLLLLLTLLVAAPSLAKVLAEGKPKGGFYWQKIEEKTGKAVYQCRATGLLRQGRRREAQVRLAALPLALLLTLPAQAATVLSVGDGDTLRVDDRGKRVTIRLACIDAPERAQGPCQRPLITQLRMHRQSAMTLGRTNASGL